ncbi:Hypothetical predicted protein [Mytilus galloprovincialis]|uniref:Uncharacterized protein n=1 Tax=Mytilus galloprovincialis TaxID=29158 RepID=A0A8B6DJX9_MYTGA|nr:Hypothetical predicted protein [Mytilus galloprovincialis]
MASDREIIDLKEIVEDRAWNFYTKCRKKWQPKKRKNVNLVFDWSEVTFDVKEPKYTEKSGSEKLVSNVIFKSVFENKSKTEQSHSLKAERQTVASCKASLTKCYTISTNMALTLSAPKSVATASVGYSAGYTVTYNKETTDQKTLTWATEGNLTVAPESKLTAELEIIEKQCEYTFETKVAINGTVIVNIHSRKNKNKFLKVYTGDMKAILSDKIKDIESDGRTVYIDIKGECDFKYGIEQQIVIS